MIDLAFLCESIMNILDFKAFVFYILYWVDFFRKIILKNIKYNYFAQFKCLPRRILKRYTNCKNLNICLISLTSLHKVGLDDPKNGFVTIETPGRRQLVFLYEQLRIYFYFKYKGEMQCNRLQAN